MKYGSLFAGIGGFDLGFNRAGMECAWQVEIDEKCRDVLTYHFPGADRSITDVRYIGKATAPPVDLICGGFPCQDVSVAGQRAGLDGERSGLWFEFLRIVKELEPKWVVIENVVGLLSSNERRDFATILHGLAESGYWWAYRVFDAQYFGVAQRRRRVFVVGCLRDWAGPAKVLFESESSPWDIVPGRKAGERITRGIAGYLNSGGNAGGFRTEPGRHLTTVAAPLTAGVAASRGVNPPGRRREDDVNLVVNALRAADGHHGHSSPRGDGSDNLVVTHSLSAHHAPRYDGESESFVFEPRYTRNGRGAASDVVPPLKAQSGQTGKGDGAPVVFEPRYYTRDNKTGGSPNDTADITNAHKAGDSAPVVAFSSTEGGFGSPGVEVCPSLKPGSGLGIPSPPAVVNMGVRRLTPRECERLQGFPDDWTAMHSDSVRYRMLGNAVAVPCAEWLGRRIVAVETR